VRGHQHVHVIYCAENFFKSSVRGTKGLFHAFRRMKKDFSLLFQALRTGLCGMSTHRKKRGAQRVL